MVKIDMDMPKSCCACPLSYITYNGFGSKVVFCSFLGRSGGETKRRKDCPLKECIKWQS